MAVVASFAVITAGPAAAATPSITAPTTGKSNGPIALSGSGWSPYASVAITLVSSSSTGICSLSADSTGAIPTQTCTVPYYLPAGSYTVHANDGLGHTANTAAAMALVPALAMTSEFNSQATTTVEAGDTINLAGSGFAASSTITSVKLGTTAVATTPTTPATNTNGGFTGTVFTIPSAQAAGPVTVTVTDAAAHSATYRLTVYRAIFTAPASAKTSVPFGVSGSGWPANATVTVYAHTGTGNTNICTIYADDTGTISSQACAVPYYIPSGTTSLIATDGFVTVPRAFSTAPALGMTSEINSQATTTVEAGDTIKLGGNGFAASSSITSVKLGTTTMVTTPTTPATNSNGGFSGVVFTIPSAQAAGPITVTVTDAAAHTATYRLTVYRATFTAPASAKTSVPFGVSGAGWPANATVTVYAHTGTGNTNICTIYADNTGTINSQACAVPYYIPSGTTSLIATDGFVTVPRAFTSTPTLGMTSEFNSQATTTVEAGDTINLAGSGFAASSSITSVKFGTTTMVTAPTTPATNSNGGFTGTVFTIPSAQAAGPVTVTATDAAAHSATYRLTVYRATFSAPTSAKTSAPFSVSGAGWPANATVTVYAHSGTGNTNICTIYADDTGTISSQACAVPYYVPWGVTTLIATDGFVTVPRAFSTTPTLGMTSEFNSQATTTVEAGDTINLSGKGFAASSTITSVKFGTTTMVTAPTAPATNSNGGFTGVVFTIPSAQAAGPITVTVTDAAAHTATYRLTVYRATFTAPASAKSTVPFSVSGTGWAANATVSVYAHSASGNTNICTVYADDTGTVVTQSCSMPYYLPTQPYTLIATDGFVTVTRAFALTPSITVTNTSNQPMSGGPAGATVNLAGTGFTASSTITSVKLGTTTIVTSPSVPSTNSNGDFGSTTFTIPSIAAGTYTLTVTDALGKSASVQFTKS